MTCTANDGESITTTDYPFYTDEPFYTDYPVVGGDTCQPGWKHVGDECLRFIHDISNNSPWVTEELCNTEGAAPIIIDSQEKTDLIMRAFSDEAS